MGLAGGSNIYYGGDRPGDNLFSESLVCLDARTGKRVWHFQIGRHGIWDYDIPAAPNLVDVTVGGKRVKRSRRSRSRVSRSCSTAQTARRCGRSRIARVPQSKVPGEKTAATQPFPTKPAPFEIQGVREEDLIDFTPELRAKRSKPCRRYDHGPLYTPAERARRDPRAERLRRGELVRSVVRPGDRNVLCPDDPPRDRRADSQGIARRARDHGWSAACRSRARRACRC
jgi:hypothetical protein